MRNKKGFTLVELMIVMVIIGILLSLLLPGVFTAREEALKTQTASNLRQVGIALYAHAKNSGGKLPANLDPELVDDGYLPDNVVLKNAYGHAFTLNEVSSDLYGLASTATLVTDDHTTKSTGYKLKADGSVDTSI